jgi:hypothetical protein
MTLAVIPYDKAQFQRIQTHRGANTVARAIHPFKTITPHQTAVSFLQYPRELSGNKKGGVARASDSQRDVFLKRDNPNESATAALMTTG